MGTIINLRVQIPGTCMCCEFELVNRGCGRMYVNFIKFRNDFDILHVTIKPNATQIPALHNFTCLLPSHLILTRYICYCLL